MVVSDGSGNLKWFERDGFTEVRRWNISNGSVEGRRGVFGSLGDFYMDTTSGDIARKVLRQHNASQGTMSLEQDGLLLWTGEKIGLLNFTSRPGFTADSFEDNVKSVDEANREREAEIHSATMRRALELQANDVRFVRRLGLGL